MTFKNQEGSTTHSERSGFSEFDLQGTLSSCLHIPTRSERQLPFSSEFSTPAVILIVGLIKKN